MDCIASLKLRLCKWDYGMDQNDCKFKNIQIKMKFLKLKDQI